MDELGFHFHSLDGVYWDESACYHFTAREIDMLEAVTVELHEMTAHAARHIIEGRRYAPFALAGWFIDWIEKSWEKGSPSLYGRFDLRYDGTNSPQLLEYNADTPTSLIEASIAQWNWQQQVFRGADQFNSLHEKLIARWREIRATLPVSASVHFTCVRESEEDSGNIEYLRDTALQAGIDAQRVAIEDIGWAAAEGRFVDLDNNPIRALFKLYPWEWMMREEFGPHIVHAALPVIEPPWKVLLSCKAVLAVLWELYPDHPNLLPSFLDANRVPAHHVRKPIYSREGANIEIHGPRGTFARPGTYGAEGHVYQAFAPLPGFDGNYPVIGSWIVGDQPAGIGIREDVSPVTTNTSRFVPHYFD
jgi:glutathionylspermidine synthase